MKEHFSSSPKSATYTSKTIQNEIVDICVKQVVEKSKTEIKDNGMLSILVVEAVDISNVEQMPIVIRYVDINNNKKIKKHCLCMVECTEGV